MRAVILVSESSIGLAHKISQAIDAVIYSQKELDGCTVIKSYARFIKENWSSLEQIVFIGAMGICVRSIAPCVKDKYKDPAVVCVDSTGKFVIPVLSGHIGGANDLAISADLDHMAEKYEVSGDTAKAAKAREASQAYRESAAKKQSDAIARLNNKYLPGNDKNVNTATEQKAPSKQELQEIYKQSTDDQSKQDREIEDLDKQLEKNSEEFGKNDKKLKEANQKLTEAATPYQEAHKERQAATEKREQADKELNAARQREEMANNGGSEFAKQYAKEQRKQAEANARQAAKEEETAKAKEAKAEKKLDTARKEQQAAADKWRGSLDQYNDLSKQKETAEKKRDESTRRAQAAQTALNAQEEMEKHDEAVSKHRENVDATKEKRLQMDDYSQQQKKAQAEADAWENLGVNAYINSGSNMGDKFFANADKYKEQANQAGKKKEEARKEWEHSKENLKQTYQDAYSEDALFDAYTAKVDYDKSMAELNKGTQ